MIYDVAIIGAGIAGASLAAELAAKSRVLLLEAEGQPGYHATGRSAAFWSETYGGTAIQPLTTASYGLLNDPPAEFAEGGFLHRRGALHIADADGLDALDDFLGAFEDGPVELNRIDSDALRESLPGLAPHWLAAAAEPSCADIDVGALHHAYLAAARRAGVDLCCSARVERIERRPGDWRLEWQGGSATASLVVDAAGAWADEVADMAGLSPVGIRPMRRTMIQLQCDPPPPPEMPLVVEIRGRFYFKSEAGGKLWLSPHDETPESAGDTAPVEIDVAKAIDRFERAVDWRIERLERKWAGQRSFAPDRRPVYGFDPTEQGFFWCAGQGGFGIQTAPAAARLCASLVLGGTAPGFDPAIDSELYAPARLRSGD